MSSHATFTTSWDDGHPLDERLAELLLRYGLTGTFYIPRQSQLEVLKEPQIRRLSESFEIGAHTLDHLSLTTMSLGNARTQIVDSRRWVSDVTGRPCEMFCPPLGRFAAAHRSIMATAGFLGYRTVELLQVSGPKLIPKNGDCPSIVEMPTTVQAHPHQRSGYLKNAAKRGNLKEFGKSLIRPKLGDWEQLAVSKIAKSIRLNSVFHLWGHSWEIEENQQWEPLERIFQEMARRIDENQATCHTNAEICRTRFG